MGQRSARFRYDSPLRRRARLAARLARSVVSPGMYPSAPVARAFWFDGIANFGDGLTPWILRRAGIIPILATASTAELAGVGSILEMLPTNFAGQIWGSGSLRGERIELPEARFLAVRGPLTRDLVAAPRGAALGDPGILVSRFLRRPRRRWELGIVPHHMHEDDPLWPRLASARGRHIRIINVRRSPSVVLREIAQCETVLTTSLHGLITADSYGIPAAWMRREPDLWGGRFKFDDYELALSPGRSRMMTVDDDADLDAMVAQTAVADAAVVHERQEGLLRTLEMANLSETNPLTALSYARRRQG